MFVAKVGAASTAPKAAMNAGRAKGAEHRWVAFVQLLGVAASTPIAARADPRPLQFVATVSIWGAFGAVKLCPAAALHRGVRDRPSEFAVQTAAKSLEHQSQVRS